MQLEGITMPYNSPDYGEDPNLWLDFTSTAEGVNPGTKALDKDAFDSTYWQSKQINAVIMPWIPFFSNCDGHDSHIVPFDAFEYTEGEACQQPAYDDIRIVNPLPSQGLEPVADKCTLEL